MLERTRTRALRACLVTGSPNAGRCGIHDYTATLGRALDRQGIDVDLIDQRDWSPRGTVGLALRLRRSAPDVVQMQYPMIVGWRSLGPHATGFLSRNPQVVTLHEFTTFDRFRRASLRAFAVSASRIVMTTAFEAARFYKQFPGARAKTTIIPIGSNVPFRAYADAPRDRRTIVYFGQIKPLKGLEDFIELVRIATAKGLPWDFQIVGAPVDWARDFLVEMRRKVEGARIAWLLDRGDDEAAELLSRASAAYLAYPDGASERRGSLIAALGNGAPVVTTDGRDRPADMSGVVLLAADPGEACARLEEIFADAGLERRLREAGPAYVRRFDWDSIAASYVDIYRQVAGSPAVVGLPR